VRERILSMILDGKKLDEVIAARPTTIYDAQWGQEQGWTADDFVPIVYYALGGGGRLLDR